MLGRIAACAALIALASCASAESAGRNSRMADARASAAPASTIATPAPPSAQVSTPAPTAPAPTQSVLQPSANAPPVEEEEELAAANGDGESVVVPGVRQRQVQPPSGDPRSNAERMEDIRAWDRCVSRVQDAVDGDPMSPQLDTPEDYCSQSLGMANRNAIPASRLERQR